MVSKWWPGFRKTTSRRFFAEAGSSVSSLAPFFVNGDARMYKDVPLPVEFDLQAAMRKAKAVGPSILKVVLRGKGLGFRTKECDFESVVGQVYSEEESKRFIGERWEATILLLSWSKAAVQAFLAGWPCTVEASFRAGKTRIAIIRSADRRLQHDFGCSLIRPAEPRKRQNAQVLVWSKPGKTTAGSQKAAKSWASVVRGNTTPPVSAKRPLAGSESMDPTALGAITPTQVHPRKSRSRQGRNGWTPYNLRNLQCWKTGTHGVGREPADNEDDEFKEHDGFSPEFGEREGSRPKPLASQNSTLPDLCRIEWCGRRSSFQSLQTRLRCLQLCCPFLLRALITNDEHFTGGCENGGAVLRELLSVSVVGKGFGAVFTSKTLLAQYSPVRLHVPFFKEHGPVIFTSGSFGNFFVNLLFDQWLATANYPRVMCFEHCLCLLPIGSFQGNSEKRWLFFVVSGGCGDAFTSKPLPAYLCPMWSDVTDFKELGLVYVANGSLGAVFVNVLSALLRPGWMHLHATVRSPWVMCLTNCLCLIPSGLFEGNNLVIAFMKFLLGKLWRFATHSRHRRACPCTVAARRVGKMRTRWSRHRRFRRAASLSAPNMAVLVVVAIPVSDVVLILGGVLRCRAPWFDGTNEGPCLSDFTWSQLQCVTRGHCSAATPISGTVGLARRR